MLGSGLQCGADGSGAGGRDIAGGQGSARGDRQGEAYPRRGAETGEGHLRAHVWLSHHAPPKKGIARKQYMHCRRRTPMRACSAEVSCARKRDSHGPVHGIGMGL
jgi:hypothetical protein